MLVRRLLALTPVLALVLAGCGNSGGSGSTPTSTPAIKAGPTKEISGPWTGKLTQAGIAPFRIAAAVDPDGTGLVAYTGLDCAGKWKLTSRDGPRYVFTEEIDRGEGGECKGTGTVHLSRTALGDLSYRFEGGGVTSSGVLMRGSLRALIAIFRQTGMNITRATVTDTIPK